MATGAAAAAASASQQQQALELELFEAMHAELLSDARSVSAEFGADVCAVAFRPGGGGAARHEFLGVPRAARAVGRIRRAVARDVSAMGTREVVEHGRELRALRAVVERELLARAAARAEAAAGDKRPPEQEEEAGGAAGDSKIRRIIID